MNELQTDWWRLCLPPEWEGEQDEDSMLIGDRDGVGTIEISTLLMEAGAAPRLEVAAAAELLECGVRELEPAVLAGLRGFCRQSREESEYLREWLLDGGKLLLFITYSCENKHAGLDDSAVDELLESLELASGE